MIDLTPCLFHPFSPRLPSFGSIPVALPAGWTEHVDPATGRKFYYQKSTGATTWTAPPAAAGTPGALPAGWSVHTSKSSGKTFYAHVDGRKTKTLPTE